MNKTQVITACAFLYNQNNQMLAVRRSSTKKFLPNKWELIGGHVEFGETCQEALKREVKEEIHIDIDVLDPFYVFTYTRDYNTKHAIEVVFFARQSDTSQPIILNKHDHEEYRRVDEKEALELYGIEKDQEYEAVKKGFEILKLSKTIN